jgi:hypothetical protein
MEFEEIMKRLDSIDQRLANIEKGCSKMSGHVDFVERAYTAVRKPMNFLMAQLMGTPKLPPLIENKNFEESNE